MPQLQYIEKQTGPNPTASIIWLHGLGASGHDFEPIVPEMMFSTDVRFIFPHAPNMSVTVNGGMVMPAWYDILSIEIERRIDTKQIESSAAAIGELIDQEIDRGIPSHRIIIAGFSQGGAVAYQTALSYPQRLAGVIALSTYFATSDTLARSEENAQLPVFIGHGSMDEVVPEVLGLKAKELLEAANYQPEYHRYPIAHSVCMEEITDINHWINQYIK